MKNLSNVEIAIIKGRILRGDKYSDIASDYRINQGRIADLKFGRIHAKIAAADLSNVQTDLFAQVRDDVKPVVADTQISIQSGGISIDIHAPCKTTKIALCVSSS